MFSQILFINWVLGAGRNKAPYSAPGKNFQITPGKRGTGYGYVGVTIGAEFKYMESDYEAARQLRSKEMADHKSKLKGQAFKLFSHPQTLFDTNPYRQVCTVDTVIRTPGISTCRLQEYTSQCFQRVLQNPKIIHQKVQDFPKESQDMHKSDILPSSLISCLNRLF